MAKKSFIGSAVILMIASLNIPFKPYRRRRHGVVPAYFPCVFPHYPYFDFGSVDSCLQDGGGRNGKRPPCQFKEDYGALVIVLLAGLAVSLLILIFINPIVNVILKDSRTYYSMLLLIPCIPVIAAASALKGYFNGIQDVVPTACSQVVEQLVKTFLGLWPWRATS